MSPEVLDLRLQSLGKMSFELEEFIIGKKTPHLIRKTREIHHAPDAHVLGASAFAAIALATVAPVALAAVALAVIASELLGGAGRPCTVQPCEG